MMWLTFRHWRQLTATEQAAVKKAYPTTTDHAQWWYRPMVNSWTGWERTQYT
jgi:hypothetical protein